MLEYSSIYSVDLLNYTQNSKLNNNLDRLESSLRSLLRASEYWIQLRYQLWLLLPPKWTNPCRDLSLSYLNVHHPVPNVTVIVISSTRTIRTIVRRWREPCPRTYIQYVPLHSTLNRFFQIACCILCDRSPVNILYITSIHLWEGTVYNHLPSES